MAQRVDLTQRNIEALNQKMREEQAAAAAVAQAQDAAAGAFYRQIDSVKQLSGGLQELQRIQVQIRQAKNTGIFRRVIIWRWYRKPPQKHANWLMQKRWPRRKKRSSFAA